MCTPALPKPTPAYRAASIMPVRASRSDGASMTRRNHRPRSDIARAHQTSLIGLAPL